MGGGIPPCITDSHLCRVTNTRCRIGTVFSPDDGHIVARNMERKLINILRKFVHQDDSVYKRLYKDAWSTKYKKEDTPHQDLDADIKAGHNNYSGFTKVRISIGKGTILTDVYCYGAGETYQIRDATLLRLYQGHTNSMSENGTTWSAHSAASGTFRFNL